MADIDYTAAKVSPVYPTKAEIFPHIAIEAITAGQVVYFDATTGKCGIADGNVAAKDQARGIALQTVGAGQAVDVIQRGHVYGFTLTNQDYEDLLYLSDTAGDMCDAAGESTSDSVVGRVVALSDSALTKVVFVDIALHTEWS